MVSISLPDTVGISDDSRLAVRPGSRLGNDKDTAAAGAGGGFCSLL